MEACLVKLFQFVKFFSILTVVKLLNPASSYNKVLNIPTVCYLALNIKHTLNIKETILCVFTTHF